MDWMDWMALMVFMFNGDHPRFIQQLLGNDSVALDVVAVTIISISFLTDYILCLLQFRNHKSLEVTVFPCHFATGNGLLMFSLL